MMASLSSLVYLTSQKWIFFPLQIYYHYFFIFYFLIAGSGHIESSVSYRWQGEAGELIACDNPVFPFSVTVHYLNRFSFYYFFFFFPQSDSEFICAFGHTLVCFLYMFYPLFIQKLKLFCDLSNFILLVEHYFDKMLPFDSLAP